MPMILGDSLLNYSDIDVNVDDDVDICTTMLDMEEAVSEDIKSARIFCKKILGTDNTNKYQYRKALADTLDRIQSKKEMH